MPRLGPKTGYEFVHKAKQKHPSRSGVGTGTLFASLAPHAALWNLGKDSDQSLVFSDTRLPIFISPCTQPSIDSFRKPSVLLLG